MSLPFTVTDFFDVMAAYNMALWPAALGLWIASLALVIHAVRAIDPAHRQT